MANRDILTRIVLRAKDETSGAFKTIRQNLGGIVTLIGAYFGARTFGGAVSSAADFEAGMSRVRAATGASAEEMETLRDAAEAAGTNTKFTATDAAGALENLAKAGLNAGQAVQALPAVLDLAAAGGVELGRASEFITRAVSGMGLSFDQAGRVADVLAQGANASNTSVEGLANALSFAAPVAQSLGLSLEDTVAIIGKFSDAGIDASRAGTALNSILSQFSDPASRFRRELGEAGITTTDFGEALRQLEAVGPKGQKAILAVGQEAGPALRALLGQGIGALDALAERLRNSEGSAKTFAKVMTDNLEGATKGFGSAWEALQLKLGTPLLEPLKEQVVALTERLREFVGSGAAARVGDAIASAFRAAAKVVNDFLDGVDFDAFVAKTKEVAGQIEGAFAAIAEKSRAAGAAFDLIVGTFSAGFDVIKGVIFAVAERVTDFTSVVFDAVASINEAFSKITVGDVAARFAQAAREMREEAGAVGAVAKAFGEESRKAFASATAGAEQAQRGWDGMTGSVKRATKETVLFLEDIQRTKSDLEATAAELDGVGESSERAATSVGKVGTAAAQAGKQTRDLARDAADAASELEQAFNTLHIQSSAKLQETADKAKTAYETIKRSGKSTAEDLQRAFLAYAEAAIAANNGVVSESLKVEAALRGVRLEASGLGDHIAVEFDRVGASARRAAHEIDGVSEAQRRLASAQQELSKPGASGSVQNLPDNLTDEQLRDLNLTATQREDYLLNRNLSPEDRAAGIVKRSVATGSTSHRSLAIRKGLTDPDQIAAFEEVIGDLLAVKRHKAFVKLQSGTPVDAKTFQQMMLGAQRAAVREALQIAREVGGNVPGTGRPDGAPHPLAAVHRVQIVSGARVTNVDTASSSDAERLVGELQRLGARS